MSTCHPVMVPSYLHEFDDANDKVGAECNPQSTEVIYYVADLDAAPLDWKIDEVRKLASVSTVAAGSTTLGVAVGPRQFVDQLLFKADIQAMRERVQLCQGPRTECALLRDWRSAAPTTSTGCMATQSCKRNELLKSTTRFGQRTLEGLFPGFTKFGASHTQRRPVRNRIQKSARHCGSSTPWSSQHSQTTHPGDDTRCSCCCLLPKQPLETRIAAVIDTATTTYHEALDGKNQTTA